MCSSNRSFLVILWLLLATLGWSQKPAVAVFVARPYGLTPAVIEQAAGKIVIMVADRSHQKLATFQLTNSATKASAHSFAVPVAGIQGAQADWQETVTLTAGTYTLSEVNHPTFHATLIVK